MTHFVAFFPKEIERLETNLTETMAELKAERKKHSKFQKQIESTKTLTKKVNHDSTLFTHTEHKYSWRRSVNNGSVRYFPEISTPSSCLTDPGYFWDTGVKVFFKTIISCYYPRLYRRGKVFWDLFIYKVCWTTKWMHNWEFLRQIFLFHLVYALKRKS